MARAGDGVDALTQGALPGPYDEAARLLGQLKDLAAHQGREAEFEARLGQIVERYPRRQALLRRLRKAKLV